MVIPSRRHKKPSVRSIRKREYMLILRNRKRKRSVMTSIVQVKLSPSKVKKRPKYSKGKRKVATQSVKLRSRRRVSRQVKPKYKSKKPKAPSVKKRSSAKQKVAARTRLNTKRTQAAKNPKRAVPARQRTRASSAKAPRFNFRTNKKTQSAKTGRPIKSDKRQVKTKKQCAKSAKQKNQKPEKISERKQSPVKRKRGRPPSKVRSEEPPAKRKWGRPRKYEIWVPQLPPPPTKPMIHLAREFLNYLCSFRDVCVPFVRPVPRIPELADYFEVIREPIDLGTIRDRLRFGYYKPNDVFSAMQQSRRFLHDLRLMFDNAFCYNEPRSYIHVCALQLHLIAEEFLSSLPEPCRPRRWHFQGCSRIASAFFRCRPSTYNNNFVNALPSAYGSYVLKSVYSQYVPTIEQAVARILARRAGKPRAHWPAQSRWICRRRPRSRRKKRR
eukprot:17916_1